MGVRVGLRSGPGHAQGERAAQLADPEKFKHRLISVGHTARMKRGSTVQGWGEMRRGSGEGGWGGRGEEGGGGGARSRAGAWLTSCSSLAPPPTGSTVRSICGGGRPHAMSRLGISHCGTGSLSVRYLGWGCGCAGDQQG